MPTSINQANLTKRDALARCVRYCNNTALAMSRRRDVTTGTPIATRAYKSSPSRDDLSIYLTLREAQRALSDDRSRYTYLAVITGIEELRKSRDGKESSHVVGLAAPHARLGHNAAGTVQHVQEDVRRQS